jgi:hypothetical protein
MGAARCQEGRRIDLWKETSILRKVYMKTLTKSLIAGAVALALVTVGTQQAQAGGWPIAAGVVGGLAAGTVIGATVASASAPAYYGYPAPVYPAPAYGYAAPVYPGPVVAPAPAYYPRPVVVAAPYPYYYGYPGFRAGFGWGPGYRYGYGYRGGYRGYRR